MRVFLDTEYTDELRHELISVGMVAEDGQQKIYLERSDFPRNWCNRFVDANVLPHLGDPAALCTLQELGQRLQAWFTQMPRSVQLAYDSPIDMKLLMAAIGGAPPPNLSPVAFDLRPLVDTTVFHEAVCRYHEHAGRPWHHALHDAQAHRSGWLAWSDERRRLNWGRGVNQ